MAPMSGQLSYFTTAVWHKYSFASDLGKIRTKSISTSDMNNMWFLYKTKLLRKKQRWYFNKAAWQNNGSALRYRVLYWETLPSDIQ